MKLTQDNVEMKQKKNIYARPMKILSILLLLVLFISVGSQIFAQINEGYATESIDVTETTDWIKSSVLAQPIGSFLLWIGGIIEWGLGRISVVVTGGDAVMPWADAILFNAIPILDVNFINPATGSIVGQLSGVIQSMYYTVLGLAIAFFSIAVMIMAIKLAISAIASEKAKYKNALVHWATALVLLFTLHYFISFVFFLNEKLVEVAAGIATTEIGNSEFVLGNLDRQEAIDDAIDRLRDEYKNVTDDKLIPQIEEILRENPDYYEEMITRLSHDELEDFFGAHSGIADFNAWTGNEWRDNTDLIRELTQFYMVAAKLPRAYVDGLNNNFTPEGQDYPVSYLYLYWTFQGCGRYQYEHPDMRDVASIVNEEGHENDGAWEGLLGGLINGSNPQWGGSNNKDKETEEKNKQIREEVKKYETKWLSYVSPFIENNGGMFGHSDAQRAKVNHLKELVLEVNKGFGSVNGAGSDTNPGESSSSTLSPNDNKMPITMMAQYFRKNAYMPKSTKSLVADNIYLPNCIMYLIFTVQSLLYFFAYMKRLFYVVVLAMMGPIIIVFDFFMRS